MDQSLLGLEIQPITGDRAILILIGILFLLLGLKSIQITVGKTRKAHAPWELPRLKKTLSTIVYSAIALLGVYIAIQGLFTKLLPPGSQPNPLSDTMLTGFILIAITLGVWTISEILISALEAHKKNKMG